MKKLKHSTDYRAKRQAAYPLSGDALDAIYKGFVALKEQGLTLPEETLAWMEACGTVKTRIRKRSPAQG